MAGWIYHGIGDNLKVISRSKIQNVNPIKNEITFIVLIFINYRIVHKYIFSILLVVTNTFITNTWNLNFFNKVLLNVKTDVVTKTHGKDKEIWDDECIVFNILVLNQVNWYQFTFDVPENLNYFSFGTLFSSTVSVIFYKTVGINYLNIVNSSLVVNECVNRNLSITYVHFHKVALENLIIPGNISVGRRWSNTGSRKVSVTLQTFPLNVY